MGNVCCCQAHLWKACFTDRLGGNKVSEEIPMITSNGYRAPVSPDTNSDHKVSPHVVVGLYTFSATEEREMSFSKGDRMMVLEDSGEDWLKVQDVNDKKKQGFVPRKFLVEEESLEREDWFFGAISVKEAENVLRLDKNIPGIFLVRYSENSPSGVSLSIKERVSQSEFSVQSYIINVTDNGNLFLVKGHEFPDLKALIHHHTGSENASPKLTQPCHKLRPQMYDLSYETSQEKNWEIPLQDLDIGQQISSGNFGVVYRAVWKNKTTVAVKKLKQDDVESLEEFKKEAEIMKAIKHDCILALFGIASGDNHLFIVTEFMENGSLRSFLHKNRNRLTKTDLLDFSKQCIRMCYNASYNEVL
ncbi:tyrosine-protein kinase Src64B-like [Ctenocephalides felis]|uniref:tyrosine-protein kinase Src64B-like n=1 Tax=Ctenocephalides felis TaxID=7515 RepID=UPI000E6E2C3F|nr:tyrosine-protein kinase Src64B-like [Ctenocephalides felis]